MSAEPVYRVAEKEWKDFIDAFTDLLVEADPQIPHLPPKDVIHRIYRDVRTHLAEPMSRLPTSANADEHVCPCFAGGVTALAGRGRD